MQKPKGCSSAPWKKTPTSSSNPHNAPPRCRTHTRQPRPTLLPSHTGSTSPPLHTLIPLPPSNASGPWSNPGAVCFYAAHTPPPRPPTSRITHGHLSQQTRRGAERPEAGKRLAGMFRVSRPPCPLAPLRLPGPQRAILPGGPLGIRVLGSPWGIFGIGVLAIARPHSPLHGRFRCPLALPEALCGHYAPRPLCSNARRAREVKPSIRLETLDARPKAQNGAARGQNAKTGH